MLTYIISMANEGGVISAFLLDLIIGNFLRSFAKFIGIEIYRSLCTIVEISLNY
ncbi:MAG: hypothetical protein ABDH19_00730 [Thermodesulfovibrio sp.]